jgi:hypothetical protein
VLLRVRVHMAALELTPAGVANLEMSWTHGHVEALIWGHTTPDR